MSWRRTLVVARYDLRQLRQSRDFWLPMSIMGLLFFVALFYAITFVQFGSKP